MIALALLSFGEPWLKLSLNDYIEAKNRMAAQAIDLADRAAPGLKDHIEVVEALYRSGECTMCRTRLLSREILATTRVYRRWSDVESVTSIPA
ncbi:MAG: hypothetical protein SWK76_03735 [Actinomycetota bacterium]|nr:hypothetical protein [Actinomycetota bacterium]